MTLILLKLFPCQLVIPIFLISSLQQIRLLLWYDNHSTLTSLTNKFIPSKLSNLHWVNQKLKRIARQRDRVFQKHSKSGKPADRKNPSNFLTNPTLTIFLMWPQMILPPTQYKKLYTSQKFQTRFCLCCTSTQTQFCPSGRPHESHYS